MNNALVKVSLVISVCFISGISVLAQANQRAPESVAKAYIEASIKSDWATLAGLMHPDALKIVRTFTDKIAEKDNDSKKEIEKIFGVSRENYSQLSNEQVYAKLIADYFKDTMVSEMLAKTTYTLVGQVAEGGELVHVIFRMETNEKKANDKTFQLLNMSYSVADIITLKRHETTWKTMLSPAFEAMIAAKLEMMAMIEEWMKAEERKKAESQTSTASPKSTEVDSSSTKSEAKKATPPKRKKKTTPNR